MKCEFPEKMYETFFNCKLIAASQKNIRMPSQNLEAAVGFDAMADLAKTSPYWHQILANLRNRGLNPPNVTSTQANSPYIPKMKARGNLFIQYKVPEYLSTKRANHWNLFQAPFYRFAIDSPWGQFETLVDLERQVGLNALVIYASPIFHTVVDLCQKDVIRDSLLVKPSDLEGHTRVMYDGDKLFGNPTPAEIPVLLPESYTLTDYLGMYRGPADSDNPESEGISFRKTIENILSVAGQDPEWKTAWARIAPFTSTWDRAREIRRRNESEEIPQAQAHKIAETFAFLDHKNITWLELT